MINARKLILAGDDIVDLDECCDLEEERRLAEEQALQASEPVVLDVDAAQAEALLPAPEADALPPI